MPSPRRVPWRSCRRILTEELLALAKAEGYELSDEDLEMVSGGWNNTPTCPQCGSKSISYDSFLGMHICQSCGYEF